MDSGEQISLTILGEELSPQPGSLISVEAAMAEIRTEAAHEIAANSLVQFETARTLYLGQVLSSGAGALRVRIEHTLDLERAAAIHRLWCDGSRA